MAFLPAMPAMAHGILPPEIKAKIPPRAPGALSRLRSLAEINKGRQLFERGTFDGNGRTCATCHAAREGFALSPADVRRRKASDPLFIFEQVPALAALENGEALRARALICENVDGFRNDDGSAIPCVLRSVPHTLSLSQSINPQTGFPRVHALGWGGDGSARDGALRDFAVGAVVQHFTKSLDRVEGVDFRLPTARELDAMEAFQLSLGRQAPPPNVDPHIPGFLVFHDDAVTAGQTLFAGMPSRKGTRRCSGCHTDGGALNDKAENEQRANGNDRMATAPACFFDAPLDGGFGLTPVETVPKASFCANGATGDAISRGDRFFSVPPAIEAANVPPFFHDNSADTLEEVVAFYRTDTFNESITGAGNGFLFDNDQRDQIAAFVRALAVLENIREAIVSVDDYGAGPQLIKPKLLADARRQVQDAIRLLGQGAIRPYRATALVSLQEASNELEAKQVAAARADLVVASGLIAD
jgi:hypothetical protein